MLARLRELLAATDAPKGLAVAGAELSARYRAGVDGGPAALRSEADRDAYLLARMPSTTTAIARCLELGLPHCPATLTSLLDLGAGPGSAGWAAAAVLPELRRYTALERDRGMIDRGRALAAAADHPALGEADWLCGDLQRPPPLACHDLVCCAYVLNELGEPAAETLVAGAWRLAGRALLLVEAGTPRGFALLMRARERLVEQGARIAAPCPQAGPCPLAAAGEWCHLPVRVQRSRLQRLAKQGDRGWEDEPCSWLLVTREPARPAAARLVDRVHAHKAAVRLRCCRADGTVSEERLPRRDPRYRLARNVAWGDAWT